MLRLRLRETDVLPEAIVEDLERYMSQQAQHVEPSETMELRRPGAPKEVVRIGPTVTQVAGFGARVDVIEWITEAIAGAMRGAVLVIGADAFDDVIAPQRNADHLSDEERQTLVDRVLDLAERAREIEDTLAKTDAKPATADGAAVDDEWAAAALRLALEWDAIAELHATDHAGDHARTASREIDLRARTAQALGRLAGADPAAELREYAAAITQQQSNPDAAVALRSELDRVEAEGRDLVARIDAADGVALPAVRVHEIFDGAATPVIIDGDLLDAVAPSVYDLLLDKLRTEADRRRVVIVYDDNTLDAWLATVHGASVWTTGHLHLVHTHAGDEELEGVRSRAGSQHAGDLSRTVAACTKHPSALTRLTCTACKLPFCSTCIVRVTTKRSALLCIDCALERGTGVKRRNR